MRGVPSRLVVSSLSVLGYREDINHRQGRINDRLCSVLVLELEHLALYLSDALEVGVTGIQEIAFGHLFGSSEVNHVCI